MRKIVYILTIAIVLSFFPSSVFAQADDATIQGGPFTYNFTTYLKSQNYYINDGQINISFDSTSCTSGYYMTITIFHQNNTKLATKNIPECGGNISFGLNISSGYYYFTMNKVNNGKRVVGSGYIN
jgi:hypothetical protein